MQTKANAELTIKFKQVHQIYFQYESVYSFFLDTGQIVLFQILDTITTFDEKTSGMLYLSLIHIWRCRRS